MSRWYVARRETVGAIRREERKGERCGEVVGLCERGFRLSIMRRTSFDCISFGSDFMVGGGGNNLLCCTVEDVV